MPSSGFAFVPGSGGKKAPAVEIRQVWAYNMDLELKAMRSAAERCPFVAMDTEFPGVIHTHPTKHHAALTAAERYELLKANVDALQLIQVGLTFAATADSPPEVAFEVNLRGFDPRIHRHAPDSVALLAAQGIDFAAHRDHGVDPRVFAAMLRTAGLVPGKWAGSPRTWVTFSAGYDFGYMVKLLIGRKLPASMADFQGLVRAFFGDEVYDVKQMMTGCGGLYGGLERVAGSLGVQRVAGRCHQAGSDSVLTWDAYRRMRQVYFPQHGVLRAAYAGVIFGLEPCPPMAATAAQVNCGGGGGYYSFPAMAPAQVASIGGGSWVVPPAAARMASGGRKGARRARGSKVAPAAAAVL
ncbi:probable CCR4-associated factor 1 homolog 11 [Brachypodium distachyon]|uniref:poly(A)-specific ribonuclease n=1 Tax=Brachypodium distachyon TaxID=15368 RepID=I1J3I3_BRADI|nr:probable CCR4-associated factor 1 homolog 11 [Brachypodium distachyon]KQJ85373.1 hypothetical protein BRADI_5g26650v3 [Brachypodium distachyon]|eukprot:XP_003579503.1 probable CCR4-associated factor 1 homolog 11 [Brachypodium distachyon]